jgi:hypothetical protein
LFPQSFEAIKGPKYQVGKPANEPNKIFKGNYLWLWRELERGCDPDCKYGFAQDIQAPLLCAISFSSNNIMELAQLLIAYKADVYAKDTDGATALYIAVQKGIEPLVQMLIANGAHQQDENPSFNPLCLACSKGNLKLVKLLVQNGASISARNSRKETPLIAAVTRGDNQQSRLAILSYLRSNGAVLDDVDYSGDNALIFAVESDNLCAVLWLLREGVDIESQSANGNTPLTVAALYGNLKILRTLVEYNAVITHQNQFRSDAIRNACHCDSRNQKRAIECIAYLVGLGLELDEGNSNGIFHVIATLCRNNLQVLQFLLDQGIDTSGLLRPQNQLPIWNGHEDLTITGFPGGGLLDLANFIHKFADRTKAIQILVEHAARESRLTSLEKELRNDLRKRERKNRGHAVNTQIQSPQLIQSDISEGSRERRDVVEDDDRYHQSDKVEIPFRGIVN